MTRRTKPKLLAPVEQHAAGWFIDQLTEMKPNTWRCAVYWVHEGMPAEIGWVEHPVVAEALAPWRTSLRAADAETRQTVKAYADRLWSKTEEGKVPDGTTVTESPPSQSAPSMTVAQMVEKYIALRDKRDKLKEEHKKQLAPYTEIMGRLEGVLMAELNKLGVDSMKGEAGTVFKSTETSVSVKDWPTTFEFIKDHQAWDLLEARVSKTAALAIIEETHHPIPGVQVSQIEALRVRRS